MYVMSARAYVAGGATRHLGVGAVLGVRQLTVASLATELPVWLAAERLHVLL